MFFLYIHIHETVVQMSAFCMDMQQQMRKRNYFSVLIPCTLNDRLFP